ncbi:threonine/serine dehydratase [Streptomyces sp. NPDC001380]|uniref:threonine ammonia-lyase n=1 Tax=Streptomyces sp. NPDC001380 TaxID=3364566 RepID=UPI00368266EF
MAPQRTEPERTALVGPAELEQARQRIAGTVVRTPLLPCPWADDGQHTLLLKPENLQPTGAFKLRGAFNRLAALTPEEAARGVVAQSSGNHAQAVAYAARRLGVRAVVVMPDTSPAVKVDATRAYGAEVLVVPPEERDTLPPRLVAEHGYVHVPPYDDPYVIAGQGTVGLEIAEDAAALGAAVDTVLVPVSGGGLISGVAAAVKHTMPGVKVVGVEPELAADARESLRTGALVAWPVDRTYRTLADGLRTTSLGRLPFEHVRAYVDDIVTVTEDEIRQAVAVLARRARTVAEPSGAVAAAAHLFRGADLPPGGTRVAVVSGGNVDPRLLAELLAA